jgi:hypothetical protein
LKLHTKDIAQCIYEVDTEKMTCTCLDYRIRKEACKHIFACLLFVKNRGKQKVEHLDSPGNNSTGSDSYSESNRTVKPKSKDALNKPVEAHNRDFDKQSIITRLVCLNTAVEVLKTHGESIHREKLFETARQLEQ